MSPCSVQASAAIELYFYGELTGVDQDSVERHLTTCADCRRALEELTVIRSTLASRPDVEAPPGGDWSGFMTRLQDAVRIEAGPNGYARVVAVSARRPVAAVLAMAAVVTLVTSSVLLVVRERRSSPVVPAVDRAASSGGAASTPAVAGAEPAADPALTSVSEQHFERSKLVVLGLATKDPAAPSGSDWDYERQLATTLLNDTRLYRLAAEERGMKTLAGVMRDLELVLLQASMSETPNAASLAQLQRLIRRRDLITKMDVVSTAGLVP